MYTGSLTQNQLISLLSVLEETNKLNPNYLKHEDILDGIRLTWFQCMCIEHALISKGTLCSLDTGLGKTATSAGFVKRTMEDNPKQKALFFCLPESIYQTTEDYKSYLPELTISNTTGEYESILRLTHNEISDITIISYKATESINLANWIVQNIEHFCCAVFDEVHMLSQNSLKNSFCSALCKMLPSKLFLTATPITTSPVQVLTLLNMLDRDFIPEPQKLLKDYEIRDVKTGDLIDYKHLGDISDSIYPRYISWDREALNLTGKITPHLILVEPTEEQRNAGLTEVNTVIKGNPQSRQVETLKAIIGLEKTKNHCGLVYANTRHNCRMIYDILQSIGINCKIVNGEPEFKKERQYVLDRFKEKQIDVLITDLTTSLNMDCDFLVVWENTTKMKQLLGRCVRGFNIKDLDIYLILTEDTVEIEQFEKNVYRRCKWLGQALDKDVSIFERYHKALTKRLTDK